MTETGCSQPASSPSPKGRCWFLSFLRKGKKISGSSCRSCRSCQILEKQKLFWTGLTWSFRIFLLLVPGRNHQTAIPPDGGNKQTNLESTVRDIMQWQTSKLCKAPYPPSKRDEGFCLSSGKAKKFFHHVDPVDPVEFFKYSKSKGLLDRIY